MKKTGNRTSDEILDDLLNNLEKPWIFKGLSKDVEIPTKLIDDENTNFLNIISDLYLVESINRLEYSEKQNLEIMNKIKKLSEYHDFLISLKYFYQTELKKYLNILKQNEVQHFNLAFPNFRNLSSIIEYLLGAESYYTKIIVLIEFYDLFLDSLDDEGFMRNDYEWFLENFSTKLNDNLRQLTKDFTRDHFIKVIFSRTYADGIFEINRSNRLINESQMLLMAMTLDKFNNFTAHSSILTEIMDDINIDDYPNLKKILGNRYVNCLATMIYNNTKYIAINGLDCDTPDFKEEYYKNRKTLIKIIKDIAQEKDIRLKFVPISNNTKYYFNRGKEGNNNEEFLHINYEDFKKYKKNKSNRMFTCCERKLFARIPSKPTNNYATKIELAIAMPPCELCQRSIDFIKHEGKFEIIKSHPYGNAKKSVNFQDMDEIAQIIYDKKSLK